MLVEVLDREALVALAIKSLHLLGPVDGNPLARRLAKPPIDKSGLAFLLIPALPAPERPLAHPQELRRLLLAQLRRFPAVQNVQKHRHAHPLKGLRPAHPTPPKKGQTYRTDRALPKPDISCASDRIKLSGLRKSSNSGILTCERAYLPSIRGIFQYRPTFLFGFLISRGKRGSCRIRIVRRRSGRTDHAIHHVETVALGHSRRRSRPRRNARGIGSSLR